MAVPGRISLVTIGVRDLAAMTRYYEAIGFELSDASVAGEVSFFRTGGAILALWGVAELAADAGLDAGLAVPHVGETGAGDFRAVAYAINVAAREEVDDALASAEAAGGVITRPGEATDWGGYNGYFADPEGNVWEVAHNPHWPLDERGLPLLP
jgi:predicted lactoylglutathione lyase